MNSEFFTLLMYKKASLSYTVSSSFPLPVIASLLIICHLICPSISTRDTLYTLYICFFFIIFNIGFRFWGLILTWVLFCWTLCGVLDAKRCVN